MVYKFLSCQQNAEKNHDIKIGNAIFENVAKLQYLGTITTIQIEFMKELRTELTQEMYLRLRCRIISLPNL